MMNIIHSLTGTGHKDEHKDGQAHHDSATHTAGSTHTGTGVTGSSHPGTTGVTSAETAGTGAAPLGQSGTSHHTGGVLGSDSSTTGTTTTGTGHTGSHTGITTGTGHTGTHTGLTGVGGAPQPEGEGTNLTKNFGHAQDGTYGGNVDNPRPAYRQGAEETIAGHLPGRNTGQQPMGEGTDLTRNFGHAQDGTYGGNVDNPRPVGGDNTASSNIAGVPASGLPGQHAATGGQASSHSGTGGILNKVGAASGLTGAAGAISGTHSSSTHDHSSTGGHHTSTGLGSTTGTHSSTGLGSATHTTGTHHHGTGTGIVGVSDATGPGSATSGQDNLGTRLTGESGVVSSSAGQHTSGHHIGSSHTTHQYDTISSTGATSGTGLTGGSAFGSTTGVSTADRYKESVLDSGAGGSLASGQSGSSHNQHHLGHTHSSAAPTGPDGLFNSHANQPGGIRGEHQP